MSTRLDVRSRLDARATHTYTGVNRLRFGTLVLASALVGASVVRFAYFGRFYSDFWLGVAAVIVLVAAGVGLWFLPPSRSAAGAQLRFAAIMTVCALVTVLDVVASWAPGSDPVFPVTCIGVGGVLMAGVTVRPPRDILVATGVFALLLIVLLGLQSVDLLSAAPRLSFVVIACTPPLIGVTLVIEFRKIVQFHSEIAQTESTTSVDSAFGMLASEELQRLDLAAEQLLDDVASGRAALPLDAATTSSAAALASQLRLHLVEDRRQTWLHHAVTESAVLDPVTRIEDPEGMAATLSARQRDGLFSAIWQLVGSAPKPSTSLHIVIERGADAGPHVRSLQIVIETTGIPQRQIDPGAWQAIRKVGRYSVTGRAASIRIEVDCLVNAAEDR